MPDRRAFLARSAAAVGALAAPIPALGARSAPLVNDSALADRLAAALHARGAAAAPQRLASDEAFWGTVRAGYALEPGVVNLDHGWTNPTTRAAVDALARESRALQALPAERLVSMYESVTSTTVRAGLARAMGVPAEQVGLVRNATEALDTVLLGVPLRAGDEIVCSTHDYYAMLDALEQRRARDGVVLRLVRPPVPAPSLDAVAASYEAAIGPRTRLVLLTHPSNRTGQLLPVRRIADAAHRAGAQVVVDGAQSLGLFEESIADTGADFYGASAHKWLGLPVGLGVLWMRPEHVDAVWPLIPSPATARGMARFEWIGTAPEYVGPACVPALQVHETIGAARKAARLRHLGAYWRERAAAAIPQARFLTGAEPAMSCGLGVIVVPGADAAAVQRRLREEDAILVQAMGPRNGGHATPELAGLRVSPNVYTTPAELDRFVAALARAVRAG